MGALRNGDIRLFVCSNATKGVVDMCVVVCVYFPHNDQLGRTDFPHNALSPQCIVCTYMYVCICLSPWQRSRCYQGVEGRYGVVCRYNCVTHTRRAPSRRGACHIHRVRGKRTDSTLGITLITLTNLNIIIVVISCKEYHEDNAKLLTQQKSTECGI